MSIYNEFSIKNINVVSAILTELEHDSIMHWIEELDGNYVLKTKIDKISVLPTYRFAIACTLAALGNPIEAFSVCNTPELFIHEEWGDNISRILFFRLKN